MREGKLKKQPIYIGGLGARVHGDLRHRGGADARQHTNLHLNDALQLVVLGKGPGGQHEVDGRENFCHHRWHDEREHGGAHVGDAV